MENSAQPKRWTVIGGGPAGLTYLSQLLSVGVAPEHILWVDSNFQGGGYYHYQDVPANTKVKTFTRWATSNSKLSQLSSHPNDPLKLLKSMDPEQTCALGLVHSVIMNYTQQLLKEIPHLQGKVVQLEHNPLACFWKVYIQPHVGVQAQSAWSEGSKQTNQVAAAQALSKQSAEAELAKCELVLSTNVCLAIGGQPSRHTNLHLGQPGKKVIPINSAFRKAELSKLLSDGDSVAVVGGSHSAFVIMYLLDQLNLPNLKVFNIFKGEVRFAVYMKDFILYDNTGLRGEVGDWARSLLQGEAAPRYKLQRIDVEDEEALSEAIQQCGKFIYAHGYERSKMPRIIYDLPDFRRFDGINKSPPNIAGFLHYSNLNGAIEVASQSKGSVKIEGLYGFGQAFPEQVLNIRGEQESNIGLEKFAMCAQKWISNMKL